jgi:hypothetical protein
MSPPETRSPPTKVRGFLHGVGEVAEFLRESAVAVFEVVLGKWPQPYGQGVRKPKAPNKGRGPIAKIAPFPTDD